MSRYTTIRTKLNKYGEAASILPQMQTLYHQSQSILALMARYQSGTDSVFNEAVDLMFTVQDRQKLGQMMMALQTLKSSWESTAGAILTEDINL